MLTRVCGHCKLQNFFKKTLFLNNRQLARWNSSDSTPEKPKPLGTHQEIPKPGFIGRHSGKFIFIGFALSIYIWQQIQLNDNLHRNSKGVPIGEILRKLPTLPAKIYNDVKLRRKVPAAEILKDHNPEDEK